MQQQQLSSTALLSTLSHAACPQRELRTSPSGRHVAFISSGAIYTEPIRRSTANGAPSAAATVHTNPLTHPVSTGTAYGGACFQWTADASSIVFSSRGMLFLVSVTSPSTLDSPLALAAPATAPGTPPPLLYAPACSAQYILAVAEFPDRMAIACFGASANDNCPFLGLLPAASPLDIFTYDPVPHPSRADCIVYHAWRASGMMWNASTITIASRSGAHSSPAQPVEWTWTARYVAPASASTHMGSPQFSPDGKYLSFLSDQTGYNSLWIAGDADDFATHKVLFDGSTAKTEVAWHSWAPGARFYTWVSESLIALTLVEDAALSVYVLKLDTADTAAQSGSGIDGVSVYLMRKLSSVPTGYIDSLSPARDKTSFFCLTNSVQSPGATLLVQLSADARAESATAYFQPPQERKVWDSVLKPQLLSPVHVTFPTPPASSPTTGGPQISHSHALLFIPRTLITGETVSTSSPDVPFGVPKPSPVAFFAHGGPTGMVTPMLYPTIHYFVARGWIVCAVNYRGSRGYGREYRELLNGNWGLTDVQDMQAAQRYLVDKGVADPAKCFVYGGSAGGWTTLLCLALHGDSWACGIDINGVSDSSGLAAGTHLLERYYPHVLLGESKEVWEARAPLAHAHKIRKPLLVFQGAVDSVVPKQQSIDVCNIVSAAGGQVTYVEYPNENHVFSNPATYEDLFAKSSAFLDAVVLRGRGGEGMKE